MANWKEPKSDYTAGSPVTPSIFNGLAENEKFLNETKITTDEVQNATVKSAESAARTNLAESETVKSAFGKIRKWFSDLRALAFKSKVDSDDINGVAASKVTGLHSVAMSGNYNQLNNKPSITKAAIGLGNVVNERQYSAVTPPPYPVTSVNGKTGAVTLDVGGDVSPTGTYPNMTVGNAQKVNSINIRNESGVLKADEFIVERKKLLWQGYWDLIYGPSSLTVPNWDYRKPFEVWFETTIDFPMCSVQRFIGTEFEVFTEMGRVYIFSSDNVSWNSGRITPSDASEGFAITRVYQIIT